MRAPYAVDLLKADIPIKTRLGEIRYWYVSRKTRNFIPWLARKLPRKLKYFVVIHGMVTVEPKLNPMSVTGEQLLKLWEDPKEASGGSNG